jgi:hypothetical protein
MAIFCWIGSQRHISLRGSDHRNRMADGLIYLKYRRTILTVCWKVMADFNLVLWLRDTDDLVKLL